VAALIANHLAQTMCCALCLELVNLPLARRIESKRVVGVTKDSFRVRIGSCVSYRSNVLAKFQQNSFKGFAFLQVQPFVLFDELTEPTPIA
jgi:hypothetical protein